jgi:superfamily I DNA and/or RNA helicase
MKYTANNFYSYFKECYKIDYKEFVIDNILSRKYPYKWFAVEKEELINNALPFIHYNNKRIDDLEKDIELYKLEKKLYYASFFVLGKNDNHFVKDKRFCAPLFLFPANIKTLNESKVLEIEKDSFIVNRNVLSKLEPKNELLKKDEFLRELNDIIIENDDILGLKRILDNYFTNLDTSELDLFPGIWSINDVRKYYSDFDYDEGLFKIVPASGTVFVEKSESSLRVISDLDEMAEKDTFNSSLFELLNSRISKNDSQTSIYKSRLNKDQYKALQNSYVFKNSVIVGPPGTGKTYTITSIISDAVINDQSVLVVSKTKQAVEVLRKMLEDDFNLKDYLIHTTGSHHKISLKAKIRKYLSGISANKDIKLNEGEIYKLFSSLELLEKKFEIFVDKELKISKLEFSSKLKLFDKWKKFYLKNISFDGKKLWEIFEDIENHIIRLDKLISSYSKRKIESNIKYNSNAFRKDIATYFDALDTSSFSEFKRTSSNVNQKNILKVFPIWLANLSDLNSVLPLEPDLFDIVIIDEATQCDIASALPAIFRAKRSVIVGDPNQLRHYSFVSKAKQNELLTNYKLPKEKIFDYRNRSILDLYISEVTSQEQVTFLREHFRSTPSLIEFSNAQFYDGQLEVLKATPKNTSNNQIEIIETNGERNDKGVNHIEAIKVLEKVDEILLEYESIKKAPSIGIISPLSSQVAYLNKLIKAKYDLDVLKKHNLICGSPYNFQGSEREIILLSFCVDDNTHPSALIHINKPEVLNVAITRAKSFQYIFKSISDSSLKQGSLLYKYFQFIKNFNHIQKEEITTDDFQQDVMNVLNKRNYDEIHLAYPIAGSILDILVSHQGKNYFIDLIGYPGIFKDAFPIERYKTLARTGIKSLPLHYSFWQKDREYSIKKLYDFIQ